MAPRCDLATLRMAQAAAMGWCHSPHVVPRAAGHHGPSLGKGGTCPLGNGLGRRDEALGGCQWVVPLGGPHLWQREQPAHIGQGATAEGSQVWPGHIGHGPSCLHRGGAVPPVRCLGQLDHRMGRCNEALGGCQRVVLLAGPACGRGSNLPWWPQGAAAEGSQVSRPCWTCTIQLLLWGWCHSPCGVCDHQASPSLWWTRTPWWVLVKTCTLDQPRNQVLGSMGSWGCILYIWAAQAMPNVWGWKLGQGHPQGRSGGADCYLSSLAACDRILSWESCHCSYPGALRVGSSVWGPNPPSKQRGCVNCDQTPGRTQCGPQGECERGGVTWGNHSPHVPWPWQGAAAPVGNDGALNQAYAAGGSLLGPTLHLCCNHVPTHWYAICCSAPEAPGGPCGREQSKLWPNPGGKGRTGSLHGPMDPNSTLRLYYTFIMHSIMLELCWLCLSHWELSFKYKKSYIGQFKVLI